MNPLIILRLSLALVLSVHPWARTIEWSVPQFGEYLSSQGLPFGFALAVAITAYEALGAACIALNRWVRFMVPGNIAILVAGIVMVHGREGWFVVGGGRNGVEFSVLLIMCLVTVMVADFQAHTAKHS